MEATETECLIEGPAGTGKSRAVLEKIHWLLCEFPCSRALGVRKTRRSMTESVLDLFENDVVPNASAALRIGGSRALRDKYCYANGSEFVIGGMDKSDKILSSRYDLIAAFEASEFLESDWETMGTRLRNWKMPIQQAIADTNPRYPGHWLNRRAAEGKMRRILSRHQDNPTLYDPSTGNPTETGAKYLERLAALSGVHRARFFQGLWAGAEGLVWDRYDPFVHLIDSFPIPDHWRRFCSVDFGFTNPMVCQWWAVDPDERLYRYREFYHAGYLVSDAAPKFAEWSKGERIETYVCDHECEERGQMERAGLSTTPALKAVKDSYEACQARYEIAADGKPRIFFFRDVQVEPDIARREAHQPWSTDQELEGHCWLPQSEGRAAKEEWAKVDDHGIDAKRYAVMYIDRQSRAVMPYSPAREPVISRPTFGRAVGW